MDFVLKWRSRRCESDFSLLSGKFKPRKASGQARARGETPAAIASTCWRVLVLACLVGPVLLAPAVVALLPAGFAALADRLPAGVLLAVPCTAAVLVALDEVGFAFRVEWLFPLDLPEACREDFWV